MDNQIKELIEVFRSYRDLLTPLSASLKDFAQTYDALKGDISALNQAFEGDVQGKLSNIYKTLSAQAEKATDLSSSIDRFSQGANKYLEGIDKITKTFGRAEEKLESINRLERAAEAQIEKLDLLLQEKKKSYNLKELEKTLDGYNGNVQKVAEFINQDVAKSLTKNGEEIAEIKRGNQEVVRILESQNSTLEKLAVTYQATNQLLKNAVEKEDVNESYIFDVFDKWAESRKVKIKK